MVDRHRFGQQHHAALRRAIGNRRIPASDAPSGTIIDNDSPTLLNHSGQGRLRHQKRSLQINIHLQVPLFFGAVEDSVGKENASVVEENIETAKGLLGYL